MQDELKNARNKSYHQNFGLLTLNTRIHRKSASKETSVYDSFKLRQYNLRIFETYNYIVKRLCLTIYN